MILRRAAVSAAFLCIVRLQAGRNNGALITEIKWQRQDIHPASLSSYIGFLCNNAFYKNIRKILTAISIEPLSMLSFCMSEPIIFDPELIYTNFTKNSTTFSNHTRQGETLLGV